MTRHEVILDTQLLLLLVVGSTSTSLIRRHKNTDAYTLDDYDLLLGRLSTATKIWVTPNILTECSNLLGQIGEPIRWQLFQTLRALVQKVDEAYVESRNATERGEFVRLGLADAASLAAGSPSRTLLTADFALYDAALRSGRPAENFNHYRDLQ